MKTVLAIASVGYVSAFSPVSPFTRGLSTTTAAGKGIAPGGHDASCTCGKCARVAHSVCGLLLCRTCFIILSQSPPSHSFISFWIKRLSVHAHPASSLTLLLANVLHVLMLMPQTVLVQPALMFTLQFANARHAWVLILATAVVSSAAEFKGRWKNEGRNSYG